MSGLADLIKNAIATDFFEVSVHALDRFEDRGVSEWQVIEGVATADVVRLEEGHQPDPIAIFRTLLADGSEIDCVWAWKEGERKAILVTVYFDA